MQANRLVDTTINHYKTTNTYEASFYMLYGAVLNTITTRRAQERTYRRNGISTICVLHLNNVPLWCIEMWRREIIYADIAAFIKIRTRLKEKMWRALRQG